MQIVRWSKELAPKIAELELAIFKDPWTESAIIDSINSPLFYGEAILDDEGEVIAYFGFYCIPPEAHIANLAVREDLRGRGLGNALMERIFELSKMLESEEVTLEVRPSNTKAIKLYEKYGFKVEGRRKSYYGDGEDALIMWRR